MEEEELPRELPRGWRHAGRTQEALDSVSTPLRQCAIASVDLLPGPAVVVVVALLPWIQRASARRLLCSSVSLDTYSDTQNYSFYTHETSASIDPSVHRSGVLMPAIKHVNNDQTLDCGEND